MQMPDYLRRKLIARYGKVIDLDRNPEVLQLLFADIEAESLAAGPKGHQGPSAPFSIPWLDSWVAHWTINEKILSAEERDRDFAAVLRALVDIKFAERLSEVNRFLLHRAGHEPPDGGPPEPGAPDPSPEEFMARRPDIEPPDGGPEPGAPDPAPVHFESRRTNLEPPDGGPEPGAPDPAPVHFESRRTNLEPPDGGPEPGVPDPAPEAILTDNPWILYWFMSIKAPLILEMIDAHLTRRLKELKGRHTSG